MSEFRYGDDKTIHRTDKVNVEVDEDGEVVSVWFRCMTLPFTQKRVGYDRANEMADAYDAPRRGITAIVFEDDERPRLGGEDRRLGPVGPDPQAAEKIQAFVDKISYGLGEALKKDESILEEALRLTTGARNAAYGHPLDDFTKTAAMLSALFGDKLKVPFTAEDVPKIQILVKLSRSMNTYKRDNMVDVAGYANTHEMVVQERGRRAEALTAAA